MLPDELGPDDDEEPYVPDHVRLRSRYAERLARRGVPNAEVAAAVAAARGRGGESVEQFAARLQIGSTSVEAGEAGQLTWDELPPALAFAIRRN